METDYLKYNIGGGNLGGLGLPTPSQEIIATAQGPKTIINQTPKAPAVVPSTAPTTKPASTTVASNATVIDQTIPDLNSRLSQLSNKGVTVDSQGIARYADGSLVPAPVGAEQTGQNMFSAGGVNYGAPTPVSTGVDTLDAEQKKFFEDMKASLDASTKKTVENIQKQYAVKRQQLQDINQRQQKARLQGVMAAGGRYTPLSSEGIVAAQEKGDLMEIQQLDAEEQSLINNALAAQESGNFRLMEKQLQLAEERRQEKMQAATKLNEKILEENRKIKEQTITAVRDEAVAEMLSKGISDPNTILKELNKGRTTNLFTAKQIQESIESLKPSYAKEIGDVLNDARKNGAPTSVIDSILKATSLGEAIKAAGDYSQSGTGIVGEYQFYKRDAQARGLNPVDFDTYQTQDANRKAKIEAAKTPQGLPNNVILQIDKLSKDFDSSPITKQFNEVQNKKLTFEQVINNEVKGPADLVMVFEFMKALDPTSVVREQEYNNAAKSGNIFQGAFARFNGYLTEGGGFLPQNVRKEFQNLVNQKYKVAEQQYLNNKKETARLINKKTGQQDGEDYLKNYEIAGQENTAQNLVNSQEQIRTAVIDFGKNNPTEQAKMRTLLTEVQPELGRPLTYDEVYEIYNLGK